MRVQTNWKKAVLLGTAIVVAGAGVFLATRSTRAAVGDEQVGPVPNTSDPKTLEDEKAILKIQRQYVKAFNAGDAKALAGFWAPDGEFVDAEGKSFTGRSAIAREFAEFFAESKGVTLEVRTNSIRFVSPGVALESGTSRAARAADGASHVTRYHIVHTKRDGQWQLASVRESTHVPSSNYEQLRNLEWMVGTWTARSGNQSLELSCEWAAKRNFLLRKYVLKDADGSAKTGIQIIGWDPNAGAIRSWIFDSDGGFGSEQWTREGKHWVLEATGVTRDGAETTATNILTPLDHDSFTWQSVQRDVDRVRLPDTALVKATRVKTKGSTAPLR
jgi:uncharacterized protein (TIGR02246 family)